MKEEHVLVQHWEDCDAELIQTKKINHFTSMHQQCISRPYEL